MTKAVYLDSSALVKLAVQEPESAALRKHLGRRHDWVSSALATTEVLRAVLPGGEAAISSARGVLARCDLIRVNNRVLADAGLLMPYELRSLDAIHLASAGRLGGDLAELITYDERMAAAARTVGHRVSAPT